MASAHSIPASNHRRLPCLASLHLRLGLLGGTLLRCAMAVCVHPAFGDTCRDMVATLDALRDIRGSSPAVADTHPNLASIHNCEAPHFHRAALGYEVDVLDAYCGLAHYLLVVCGHTVCPYITIATRRTCDSPYCCSPASPAIISRANITDASSRNYEGLPDIPRRNSSLVASS